MKATAMLPSPTPLGTRLIESWRTSPAQNIPGMFVSSGTVRAISKYEQTWLKFGHRCPFVTQFNDHVGNLQHLLAPLRGRPC
jgi:hypothetical protein